MSESDDKGRDYTPEEYRMRLLLERRRAVKTVRNTLLAVAILAALWWLFLLAKERSGGAPLAPAVPVESAPQNAPPDENASPNGAASSDGESDGESGDRDFSPFHYQ